MEVEVTSRGDMARLSTTAYIAWAVYRNHDDAGASRTIDAMPDASTVVLMGDVPRNRVNPIKCLARSRGVISRCVTYKEPLHERKIERAFRQAAADRGAQFRTLYNQICSYDPCPLVQGNVLVWRDRHHLTATFTMRLAPSLKSLFKAGLAGAAERAG